MGLKHAVRHSWQIWVIFHLTDKMARLCWIFSYEFSLFFEFETPVINKAMIVRFDTLLLLGKGDKECFVLRGEREEGGHCG